MKIKRFRCAGSVLLLLVFSSLVFGQTAAQIREKFGDPIESYAVSEHIWMTPAYTADGQVCEMRLYPRRVSETTNYLESNLDRRELIEVIDQFAPLSERGAKTVVFGLTSMGGGIAKSLYFSDAISITFLRSAIFYFDPIDKDFDGEIRSDSKFTDLKPAKVKAKAKTKAKPVEPMIETTDSQKSDDGMVVPSESEIVTIVWNKRTCATPK